MKFLMIRRADEETEAGVMPSKELLVAMGQYNQQLIDAGVMLDGMGLKASAHGARIDFDDGRPVLSDCPLPDALELIAGFTLIEVGSKEEAIEWAKKWPREDAYGYASIEIRQVFELEDFDAGEGRSMHEQGAAQLARQPQSLCTYLSFDGTCEEALKLYAEVFGGTIEMIMPFEGSPGESYVPEDWRNKVMHAQVNLGKWILMACDAPPGCYKKSQGFHVQASVNTAEEAERAFNALAKGGTVEMKLERTFWAERFGTVVDRFGTPWMINFQGDAADTQLAA